MIKIANVKCIEGLIIIKLNDVIILTQSVNIDGRACNLKVHSKHLALDKDNSYSTY